MTLSIACPEGTVQGGGDQDRALGVLAAFRRELYRCFSKRPDGLAELADAVLCKPDRVHMLAELSLVPECRRGHGAVYDAVNSGRVQIGRLRRSLAALAFPAWADGRIRLAADVSNWLRPDAQTSPDRLFCHTYARGKGNAQMIPGWPYSFVAALEPGRTSWTLLLDAVRLGAADDATEVTAGQVREVAARIIDAGHWHDGDPDILVIFDAGYDLTRLAWLLRDLPVEVLGRLRSDRVLYFPAPAREPGTNGRPARHGAVLKLADQQSWPDPPVTTVTETTRYGTATATAWSQLHQRLTSRAGWEDHDGELPVIEGTLIRLRVSRLPGNRSPEPLWLWTTTARLDDETVNRSWQAFLRRFDIEHTFRFLKQVLGWTRPKLRDPAAADRWTWIIIACYTQLWLARGLAEDLRLPWQRPCPPGRLTPPGSGAGSGTSARRCLIWPARRNPANPAPAARSARRTAARPPATTWARPSSETSRRRNPQAEGLNNKLSSRATQRADKLPPNMPRYPLESSTSSAFS